MTRKTKRKKTETPVNRAPLVTIKQRNDDLLHDLQNMKEKDAVKYGTHLMKMVSGNSEYEGLIFNIAQLLFVIKKYELEKKPGGLMSKIFKQTLAKEGSAYILPQVVDGPYVTRAKAVIDQKFSASDIHEDKMALAIAKASLEMHGKVVQGVKISLAEVPLFHIVLGASMEIIQKITKKDKIDKKGAQLDKESAIAEFPRWNTDFLEFEKKIVNQLRSHISESSTQLILPDGLTTRLQARISQRLQEGSLREEMLVAATKEHPQGKVKSSAISALKDDAALFLDADLLQYRGALAQYWERSLKDQFQEFTYLPYAYLTFFIQVNKELLLPFFIQQAVLHSFARKFQTPDAQQLMREGSMKKNKDEELFCLLGARAAGQHDGELVLQIIVLLKGLEMGGEAQLLAQEFLQQPDAEQDKNHKKISKEIS